MNRNVPQQSTPHAQLLAFHVGLFDEWRKTHGVLEAGHAVRAIVGIPTYYCSAITLPSGIARW